ncbi:MAG: M23 family metallopeptidase [Planctomycetes bacterium]|nr:M23 family metallopeptidase [Planctomycetota bacterium]
MFRRSITLTAVCIGFLGLLTSPGVAEDIKAPLNGVKPFQTASAVSDTLKVEAGAKTVAATDALKIQGHPNSRITVVKTPNTGAVHVADVILRDGDSLYKVVGNYGGPGGGPGGGGGGGGGGGWWARYERGPNRLVLHVNTTSPNDNNVGLGGATVKTATLTVYVANTSLTANGYAVAVADQAGGGEAGFPAGTTCTLGKIGGEDFHEFELSGKTAGATIVEATASGLTKGETDAFVTSVTFTDIDGTNIKGEYYIGDDDIFVTVWDSTKNTNPNQADTTTVTVKDQNGGSGDEVMLMLIETGIDTGIFRNDHDPNGYGVENDNLMDAGDPGIAAAGAVDKTDQRLKTDYGRNIVVVHGQQTVSAAIRLRDTVWPFSGSRTVTQNFGVYEGGGGIESHHSGIDIPQAKSTDVLCIQNGAIKTKGSNYVFIKSVARTAGSQRLYFYVLHLSDMTTDTRVHQGAVIGKVQGRGGTGGTFDHLHLCAQDGLVDGQSEINPLLYAYPNLDPGNSLPAVGPEFFRKHRTATSCAKVGGVWVLDGKVDISAEMTDNMGGDLAAPAALTGTGLKQGLRCIPYKLEYAVYDATGNTAVKAYQTTYTFDRYNSQVPLKLLDLTNLVDYGTPLIRQQGYVFYVTRTALNEANSLDTRTLANGSYKIKMRATDLAGREQVKTINVTVNNAISVEDKEVIVDETKEVTVTVTDATGQPRQNIALGIDSYDAAKIDASWVGGTSTTNAQGKAFVSVKGRLDGVSDLAIKETGTTSTGTGRITVGGCRIAVPNVSVLVGETKSITVTVTDATGAVKSGIKLVKEFLNEQKATMAFPGSDTSDANGHVTVNVTGVATGSTDFRLKDNTSSATSTGVVTVKGLVITVPNSVVTMGGTTGLSLQIQVKDTDGSAIEGAVLSVELLDPLKATYEWLISTTTSFGNGYLYVTGVSAGQTPLKVKASINGTSAIGEATVTIELPVITVENKSTVVGGRNTVTVSVRDHYGQGIGGVALEVESIDANKATTQWLIQTTTGLGNGYIYVTGVGTGTTTLKVKSTATGATGQGSITVENPVVEVENKTVTVGQIETVTVCVKNSAGEGMGDVALVIDSINTEKATAQWDITGSATSGTGTAYVRVTGVAAGTTTLRIKVTASGVTGQGTITVNNP